jgi:vacuolar-type H+-ATPase subunit D/Vma8
MSRSIQIASRFVNYYDNKLIPTFEKWLDINKIDPELSDDVFIRVCEMIYGIRQNEDFSHK